MNPPLNHLDGNAAAGPLSELMAFDITGTVGRCAGCRGARSMAECRLYTGGPGLVLRCPSCDRVMLRLVTTKGRAWLEMTGLASLQVDLTQHR